MARKLYNDDIKDIFSDTTIISSSVKPVLGTSQAIQRPESEKKYLLPHYHVKIQAHTVRSVYRTASRTAWINSCSDSVMLSLSRYYLLSTMTLGTTSTPELKVELNINHSSRTKCHWCTSWRQLYILLLASGVGLSCWILTGDLKQGHIKLNGSLNSTGCT